MLREMFRVLEMEDDRGINTETTRLLRDIALHRGTRAPRRKKLMALTKNATRQNYSILERCRNAL